MGYIDANKLKELLKERQEEKDYREVIWLIDSLQQEQPVEGMEEAAIQAAQSDMQDRQIMEASNDERMRYSRIFRRGFKAGAEWGAEHLKR